jgi:hypothetical protein
MSEALLPVAEEHAERCQKPAILKAYRADRGGAAKHVTVALPNLGALVQKHAA